jgi:outer membrane protein TolC
MQLNTIAAILLTLAAAGRPACAKILRMDRNACLQTAMENNRLRKISASDIRIAEAMVQQAKSAYWPSITASGLAGVMDDPLLFTYPASSQATPNLSLPENALYLGSPEVTLPGQTIEVPKQSIELMDRQTYMGSVNLSYPLYTGGIRKSVNRQARYGVEAAQEGLRRSELEVTRDLDKAYYGAVIARKLVSISGETLERMETTLLLTQRLYETGSGTVKKTDYLRNLSVVEVIRTTEAQMKARQSKADTALTVLMGLDYGTRIEPLETTLPPTQAVPTLTDLVAQALKSNPDLARVRLGIAAAEAQVQIARGGYKPKVGLMAKYTHIENALDTGIMDAQNTDFAAVGIGIEIPLFTGFRTKYKIVEAQQELDKMRLQSEALTDGITLQIEHAYADFESARSRVKSTHKGLKAATENRDLNVRAYQEELVETADVIEAQIMEAILEASYQKTLYERLEAQANLAFLVGTSR